MRWFASSLIGFPFASGNGTAEALPPEKLQNAAPRFLFTPVFVFFNRFVPSLRETERREICRRENYKIQRFCLLCSPVLLFYNRFALSLREAGRGRFGAGEITELSGLCFLLSPVFVFFNRFFPSLRETERRELLRREVLRYSAAGGCRRR
ncbi:MAG: hypothetical protein VB021_01300 [Oscillospiraceae bacterium]|nr:hypothetical protein [Oscillospiraceae bacterium]